jgi:hypothetical protein
MQSLIKRNRLRLASAIATAPLLFCAGWLVLGDYGRTGTVSGKVTFRGQPLPGGMVTLQAIDNGELRIFPGMIQKDGSYTVANVPVGPAKVGVGFPRMPPRFRDMGLAVDVKPGKQDFPIDLPAEPAN